MTALWILLGILALLGAVLSLDLTLSVEIREQVRITAGFLWFRFPLLPFQKKEPKAEKGNRKPPREKKRKRDAPLEEKAAELEKEPVGEKTFGETVEPSAVHQDADCHLCGDGFGGSDRPCLRGHLRGRLQPSGGAGQGVRSPAEVSGCGGGFCLGRDGV